jgi:methylamine dehydrogenase accessory protein MauD
VTTGFTVSYMILWLLVLAIAVLLLLVYRHFGLIAMSTGEGHERDGLSLGREAPMISGVDRENSRIQWDSKRGLHTLLVFMAPGCEPCDVIAPQLGVLGRTLADVPFRVVTVASGRGEEVKALEERTGDGVLCLADDGSGAMPNYEVRVTPFGFLIGPDGRVKAKGNCSTTERLRTLVEASELGAAMRLDALVAGVPPRNQSLRVSAVGSDVA